MQNLCANYLGTDLDRRYRLERLIGEGASSWVFAAQDLRLEREVAVKLLKPRFDAEQTSHRKRFVNEGRTLARLVHPHVVAVHDAGETGDGLAYLVMELSAAGSLEAELHRRKTLPPDEALGLVLPLIGALACAHDRGIIHRDVKPANVALVRERGEVRAKLLDFGIAKHTGNQGTTDAALGTPAYMAPEQARAETLGPQADVWALGVLLYRCLSGALPFDASSPAGTLLKLVQERAPRFSSVCKQLPPRVALALDRSLEPLTSRRYPDMRSFARAIAIACQQDGLALPQHPEPIGLPDFDKWRSEADVEATQPLGTGASLPSPVRAVSPLPRAPARAQGKRLKLLLALALVAGGLATLGLTQRPTPHTAALKQTQPAAAVPIAPQPALQPVRPIAPEVPSVETPPATTPPNDATTARPLARRKRVPIATPDASLQTSDAPAPLVSGTQEPAGLIKSWDW